MDHLKDPQAISWEDLKDELGFTEEEKAEIAAGAQVLIAKSRAHRLAEIRRREGATQVDIAKRMGVSQARVSRIEKGELSRTEVDTLAAYVKALGGTLKIVADFGSESYIVG